MPENKKQKTKVYTNKVEFDKANQAYSDSLNLFNFDGKIIEALKDLGKKHDEALLNDTLFSNKSSVYNNYRGKLIDTWLKPFTKAIEDQGNYVNSFKPKNTPRETRFETSVPNNFLPSIEVPRNYYYKKPTTKPVYEEVKARPVLEPIKPLGIKTMSTSVEPKLAGNVEMPAMYNTKGATQNYTAAEALQIQGKPSGYTNQGDNTGRQEFRNGGQFKDMPFGMPLKEQNPYLVPEYNQPMVGKTILPDVNRPFLEGTNASEFKASFNTGTPDEIQVPTVVGGQYIGVDGAWERYKATKGERFKNMTDPRSYSNFYNQVGDLGLMQSKPKQKFEQGGWLDGLEGDKTTQAPDVTNATEYVKNWYNSPMYSNILKNQIADSGVKNPKRIERVAKRSIKSANKEVNSPFYDVTPNIVDNPEYYGKSIDDYKGGRKINLNRNFVDNNRKLVNSLFAHELTHDNLMTVKDREYINKNTPEYNPAIHDEKTYGKLTDPGEVRSQIHSIRQLSGENKIYDPLTQPFKKEYLDKVNESYNQGTKESEDYNQLQRLRKYYSDDQITEMMNTISKSNSNDTKVYAKNGGWLDGLSSPNNVIEDNRGQWAHPGKVTKINSNQITMKGVNYPVLGVSDNGDTKMMQPGKEYNFKGKTVTEYPQKFQLGGNNNKYVSERDATSTVKTPAITTNNNAFKEKVHNPDEAYKYAIDAAGTVFYPASLVGSAIDFYQGDNVGGVAGLIPFGKGYKFLKGLKTTARGRMAQKANSGVNKLIGAHVTTQVLDTKSDLIDPLIKDKKQNGGWLNNLSTNKFDMGGVLDEEDNNTPSNVTSAMSALIPAIQKSTAQAANTNFNANLNYKTEPTAVSTTFVNNNVAKQKAAELAKDIKTYGTPEKAIIAKVAAKAMAEAKTDKNKGTIAKTQSINPNDRWMLGAANYKGGDPEQVINANKETQAIGAMGAGVVGVGSIPVVSQTLGAGFAAKGIHDIPQTVRTVMDPNVSLHDKLRAVTFNSADFLGWGEAMKGAKALGAKEVVQGAKGLVSDAVKYAAKKSVKPIAPSGSVTTTGGIEFDEYFARPINGHMPGTPEWIRLHDIIISNRAAVAAATPKSSKLIHKAKELERNITIPILNSKPALKVRKVILDKINKEASKSTSLFTPESLETFKKSGLLHGQEGTLMSKELSSIYNGDVGSGNLRNYLRGRFLNNKKVTNEDLKFFSPDRKFSSRIQLPSDVNPVGEFSDFSFSNRNAFSAGKTAVDLDRLISSIPGKWNFNPGSLSGDSYPMWSKIINKKATPQFELSHEGFEYMNTYGRNTNLSKLVKERTSGKLNPVKANEFLIELEKLAGKTVDQWKLPKGSLIHPNDKEAIPSLILRKKYKKGGWLNDLK